MWNALRMAKIVALLGFVLPWITISCSDQKIAQASGFDLASGSIAFTNPISRAAEAYHLGANAMLIAAVLAIVAGLVLSFRPVALRGRAAIVLATSLLAMMLCWAATVTIDSHNVGAAASKQKDGFDVDIADRLIRVTYAYGFWITMLALAASAFFAWQILQARRSRGTGPSSGHASNAPSVPD